MTCHIKHKPSMFETRFIVDIHAGHLQYHIFVTYFFLAFGRKQLAQCLHCIKSTSTTLRGDSYRTRGHIESICLIMSDCIANGKNDFLRKFAALFISSSSVFNSITTLSPNVNSPGCTSNDNGLGIRGQLSFNLSVWSLQETKTDKNKIKQYRIVRIFCIIPIVIY